MKNGRDFPDSRIMPALGGGFEQSYNTQVAVDTDTMLVVATEFIQAANYQRPRHDSSAPEPMPEYEFNQRVSW